MVQLAAMSAEPALSDIGGVADESQRKRFEGSLAIGMQVTAMIRALHDVERAVRDEMCGGALADAQEGLDMVCRQMRRTRARLGLRAPD